MDSLISRQAAIDAIGKASDELYENIKKGATFPQRQWFDGMAQAQSILENLPSAQPERKTGEWIPSFNGRFTGGAYWFHCSKCERIVPDVRNGGWSFCPNCGANMTEDSE